MWISYTDSEVSKFHPICEKALNNALIKLCLEEDYRVLHHQYTGSLEMDFVIQNIQTGKYLVVIEVKRTPNDIHSTRYQYQAMTYVLNNGTNSERPFYILTNLEYAFSFRWDSSKQSVYQQLLKPGLKKIGDFIEDNEEEFTLKLTDFFAKSINDFRYDRYNYLLTLDLFSNAMEQSKNDRKLWKSTLSMYLYEYIRGSFKFVNRNDMTDIRLFKNNLVRICNEGLRVNFKEIFSYNDKEFLPQISVNKEILSSLYEFGEQNVNGDSIAGILHNIVSKGHEHEGEVPTDLELGRIVAKLAHILSGDLKNGEKICDPAAGSGNLISASINEFNLSPKQIVANDCNKHLLEILSLRLGLSFVEKVNSTNTVKITNENISDLSKPYFAETKVVIMNPPYVAGIYCRERKSPLFKKIYDITGNRAKTCSGQMPLESVFLELITLLVKPGTVIACVFPKNQLFATGNEARILRELILNKFGLEIIFTYPRDGIFEEVIKDTCVLIGKAMQETNQITILSSYEKIPDLDLNIFSDVLNLELKEKFTPVSPGLMAKRISKDELMNSISNGWRTLNNESADAIEFINKYFKASPLFERLQENLNLTLKRGNAGNNGASDLIFLSSHFIESSKNIEIKTKKGMRNADFSSFLVGDGDSEFLDISINDEDVISDVVENYLTISKLKSNKKRKQSKKEKSSNDLLKILKRESGKKFPANSVLIPRAIRAQGKVYLSLDEIFVSTNFWICSTHSDDLALVLATWMNTIFYQLFCEVYSKNEGGLRKMEGEEIRDSLIPKFSFLSKNLLKDLKNESNTIEFLDLRNPKIRKIDLIWSKFLFSENSEKVLEECRRYLQLLASLREDL